MIKSIIHHIKFFTDSTSKRLTKQTARRQDGKTTDPHSNLSLKTQTSKLETRAWLIPLIVIVLLSTMLAQMLFEANNDGATTDEQIHILSGYTTLTQGHVLFDPEHPFLAKALAAVPLLFVRPNVPSQASHLNQEQSQAKYNTYRQANQWGYEMLFTSGNNSNQLLFLTRAVMAIATVLLAMVVYFWTRSLWGTASALAALALITFEPSILAHGHLANDDTVATLFFIASLAAFSSFLNRPSTRHVVIAGIILGLGLITKYSLLLLGPIFVILLIGWLWYQGQTQAMSKTQQTPPTDPNNSQRSSWLSYLLHRLHSKLHRFTATAWRRYAIGVLAIFIIAWSVIWISYGSLMIINPTQNPTTLTGVTEIPDPINKIAPYVLPAMYAKGAALLFGPGSHDRDGYLLGACYQGGRLDYFSVVTFFKTPLTTLFLFIATCFLWWRNRGRNDFIPTIIIFTLIFYLGISSLSNINIGYRHVLPVGVLIIITAAYPFSLINWRQLSYRFKVLGSRTQLSQLITQKSKFKTKNSARILHTAYCILILSAIAASIIGSLFTFPNHLSYYNILSMEPQNRPFISSDSNIDWGQGTKALYRYMQQHNINHVALDNFTGTSEAESQHYPMSPADPTNQNYKGYIALSRSTIIDHYCTKNNDWGWLVDHKDPIAIVGGSINLYKLN